MVTLGFSTGPVLVLFGMWALISGFDDPRFDRARALTTGAVCLVLGFAVSFGTIALDRPERAPAPVPAGVSGA